MSLDLLLVGLVILFALFGAITGVARQIATLASSVIAYLCARPIANALGPQLATHLHLPFLFGILAVTLVSFVVVLISVRYLLTRVLRRLVRGEDRDYAGLDRVLGFVFGGAKVALIAYVMLSALTFVEDNVTFAGQRLGISPKDSTAFAFARTHNLFEQLQFAPVKDLVRLAQALQDPSRAEKLRSDPAFRSLLSDPRFRSALGSHGMQEAIEKGDYGALLRSNPVLQLVQDRLAASRMAAAADSVEGATQAPKGHHPSRSP